MLIKSRCPAINEKDIDGWRPMMWAIQFNIPASIKFLILTGEIDLEAADNKSKAALWWAVSSGQTRNARALLREGADPKVEDKNGVSVMDVAISLGRSDFAAELSKAL
ncbi:hypothetical protein LQW54_005784 [Pestalotiopsis sp. IQ-011]